MTRPLYRLAAAVVALAGLAACAAPGAVLDDLAQPAGESADLVVHGATVTTLWDERPQAQAIAVRDGRVLAVGSDADVLAPAGPDTRVLDAGGRRILPGLNGSHLHPTRGGRFYAAELRWDGVPTPAQALDRVAEQAARTPDGEWVRVIGGWSPYQFEEARFPTPAELTEVAPDTPVFVLFLYSRGWLDAAGVRALGITDTTETPPGSRYEFAPDGGAVGGAVVHAASNPERSAALMPLAKLGVSALKTERGLRESLRT